MTKTESEAEAAGPYRPPLRGWKWQPCDCCGEEPSTAVRQLLEGAAQLCVVCDPRSREPREQRSWAQKLTAKGIVIDEGEFQPV